MAKAMAFVMMEEEKGIEGVLTTELLLDVCP